MGSEHHADDLAEPGLGELGGTRFDLRVSVLEAERDVETFGFALVERALECVALVFGEHGER